MTIVEPVPEFLHRTVLLDEAIDGLNLEAGERKNGI